MEMKNKDVETTTSSSFCVVDQPKFLKALVEEGLEDVPSEYHHSYVLDDRSGISSHSHVSVPIIDMGDVNAVAKIREASISWGVFYLVNHGIPLKLMDGVLAAVENFHKQPNEDKIRFYSREFSKTFKFYSNIDHEDAGRRNWSDTLDCVLAPREPNLAEMPDVCRDYIVQYADAIQDLGRVVFELMSESLGLAKNHLRDIHCSEGFRLLGHYYPQCPEPTKTLGSAQHTDSQFLTILLQDQIGGLQVFHSDEWLNVPYKSGALIVNVGDFMQLVTNDLYKAVYHRVLVNTNKPRKSVACFFGTLLLRDALLRCRRVQKEVQSFERAFGKSTPGL